MTPKIIFDGEGLRASVMGHEEGPGTADKLFVTFDNWNGNREGFLPLKTGRSFVDLGYVHLHLYTARNDWFLAPDLTPALAALSTFCAPFVRRAGMSFSMGGNGALLLSRVLKFDQLLFVSPHIAFASPLPHEDIRFASDFVDAPFSQAAQAALLEHPCPGTEAVIFYDPGISLDRAHARVVAEHFEAARLVRLEGGGHPASSRIEKANRFGLFIRAATGTEGIDETPVVAAHDALMQIWKKAKL
ncbi:MAG: hypothetical protein ACRBCL_04355 [Maritimibacter sp.]